MAPFSEGDRVRVVMTIGPIPPKSLIDRVGTVQSGPVHREPHPDDWWKLRLERYPVLLDGDASPETCPEHWLVREY